MYKWVKKEMTKKLTNYEKRMKKEDLEERQINFKAVIEATSEGVVTNVLDNKFLQETKLLVIDLAYYIKSLTTQFDDLKKKYIDVRDKYTSEIVKNKGIKVKG